MGSTEYTVARQLWPAAAWREHLSFKLFLVVSRQYQWVYHFRNSSQKGTTTNLMSEGL